jgi:Ca2+-binding RTX toxin-like protein
MKRQQFVGSVGIKLAQVAALMLVGMQVAWAACPNMAGSQGICTLTGTTWECDLTNNGDNQAAQGFIVQGYSAYDYSAWGVDANGTAFCEEITDTSIRTISLRGGSYADELEFQYGAYALDTHTATTVVQGRIAGGDGDDTIYGSFVSSADYADELHGDNDDDYIDGDAGGDEIFGGSGVDTILGRSGNDVISGGDGDDNIGGGDGDDLIHGDADADEICGDAEGSGDVLYGDGGDDLLYGNSGSDSAFGGVGTDACAAGTQTSCEYSQGSRPAGCP